jgi:hypothetical protein
VGLHGVGDSGTVDFFGTDDRKVGTWDYQKKSHVLVYHPTVTGTMLFSINVHNYC